MAVFKSLTNRIFPPSNPSPHTTTGVVDGPKAQSTRPTVMTVLGRDHVVVTLGLLALTFVLGMVSRVFLYGRPTPYGGPFVTYWDRYFFHALLYSQASLWVVGLPWMLYNSFRWNRPTRRFGLVYVVLILVLALNLMVDHADQEVMRFVGVHPTPSFLLTYSNAGETHTFVDSLATDAGGPFLPLILLGILPLLFFVLGYRWFRRLTTHRVPRLHWGIVAALVVLPVVWVGVSLVTPGGKFRQRKVQPYLLTLWDELNADWTAGTKPVNYEQVVQNYQDTWFQKSGEPTEWAFEHPDYPFFRTPKYPQTTLPERPWNVVFLQLETLRGWDTGHLRPDRDFQSPTPFLDTLADQGAYWTRFTTFGPPTVSGFMASHCSITPHSRHNLTVSFPHTHLLCLPDLLRKHGYQAEYFTSSDPDWDGQRVWLDRWFDRYVYDRAADELDHVLFAVAAERLNKMGRRGPFMATVVSITNHYPFTSRRAESDIAGHETVSDRILNTLHYTDQAVEQLFRAIEHEPWFEHTVFFLYGDHGYNLGEHDHTPGQRNGFRESTWSPLVIFGKHPALRQGRHEEVATLLDLVPTAVSMVGLQIPNPWQGVDLTVNARPDQTFTHTKNGITFAETPMFSMAVDKEADKIHLFSKSDLLQTEDISSQWPNVGAELTDQAQAFAQLNDYLVETDRICPR